MVPESEIKTEGHRKSGHHVLDMVLAGSALFISLCSLGLAIHSGHAMDRLVEANSRPELVFESGDADPEQPHSSAPLLHFGVTNPGAGYARVEWARLAVQGHEVHSWAEALTVLRHRLVTEGPAPTQGFDDGGFVQSTLSHVYVKPGSTRMLFSWPRTEANAALWDAARKVREGFQLTACYCSIFDECWVTRSGSADWPETVKSCAADRPESIGPL